MSMQMESRVRRGSCVALVVATSVLLAAPVVSAGTPEPQSEDATQPVVPSTSVPPVAVVSEPVVAVGLPPVPPVAVVSEPVVAVGLPPVPPVVVASEPVVAVGLPPVPPVPGQVERLASPATELTTTPADQAMIAVPMPALLAAIDATRQLIDHCL